MGFRVLKGGMLTTVQDFGRSGFQSQGFSVGGAMDVRSFKIANLLLDNPENEAELEITLIGPILEFTADTIIAITGGDFSPKLNDEPVPMYTAVYVRKGDVLSFGSARTGTRCYVAFSGYLNVPVVMGSRCTSLKSGIGGFKGRRLEAGDYISERIKRRYLPFFLSRKLKAPDFDEDNGVLRVVMGVEPEREVVRLRNRKDVLFQRKREEEIKCFFVVPHWVLPQIRGLLIHEPERLTVRFQKRLGWTSPECDLLRLCSHLGNHLLEIDKVQFQRLPVDPHDGGSHPHAGGKLCPQIRQHGIHLHIDAGRPVRFDAAQTKRAHVLFPVVIRNRGVSLLQRLRPVFRFSLLKAQVQGRSVFVKKVVTDTVQDIGGLPCIQKPVNQSCLNARFTHFSCTRPFLSLGKRSAPSRVVRWG